MTTKISNNVKNEIINEVFALLEKYGLGPEESVSVLMSATATFLVSTAQFMNVEPCTFMQDIFDQCLAQIKTIIEEQ